MSDPRLVRRTEHRTTFEAKQTMEERDFFDERDEMKPLAVACPFCRERREYQVRWRRRMKKSALPPRANEEDRARFAKARSYLIRIDDFVSCANPRCRKRIDIPTAQSVVFI